MVKNRTEADESHEESPLLSNTRENDERYGSTITAADVPAIVDDGGPGLQPESQPAIANGSAGHDVKTTQRADNPFLGGVTRTRFWLIFGCIQLQFFVATFDSTLMASSHPVITSYFNASNSASWLSTAFLITNTSFQPLFGRVSDTIGRKPPYIFAFVVLGAGTTWCALAESIGSLIAARAVCGLGAAGVMAMGAILVNDLVPIEIRGTYQSYINIFYGAGSACGAAFGGVLCETIGWRWTFGMQVPVIFVIFVLVCFTTPSNLGPRLAKTSGQTTLQNLRSFDNAGSLLLVISVAMLVLGLNLGGNVLPWSHPLIIASLVSALVSTLFLLYVENKATRPVMPLKLLSTRPRGNIIFENFFANVGANTIIFNLPLFFQAVKLESASASGFRIGPAFIFSTTVSVSTGFIINATGHMKPLLVLGGLMSLIGVILLSLIQPSFNAWVATGFLVPMSMGMGFNFPTSSVAILAASTKEDQAVTTSTLSLFRTLGIVMGVALSSLILQNALVMYLEALVTGSQKKEIILMVRKSVHAILTLEPKHQGEVTEAYAKALKMTFLLAVVAYVAVNALILPAKIPRLNVKGWNKKKQGNEDVEDEAER